MKKILIFSPNFIIFVPFVRTFFNSYFIFEDGEVRLFLSFFIIYISFFYLFYKFLCKIFSILDKTILLYLTSWIGFVFFQYTNWTKYYYYSFSGFLLEVNNFAFLTWSFVLLLGLILIIQLSKFEFVKIFLGSWTLLLLLSPLTSFLSEYLIPNENEYSFEKNFSNVSLNEKPDIYFILYDGLASLDTLDKYYQYNAEPLTNFLSQNNFYTAKEASSSYGTTNMSLATIFEAEYLLQDGDRYKINNKHVLENFDILQSDVFQILIDNGYSIGSYSNYVTCNDNELEKIVCLYRKTPKQIIYQLLLQTPFRIIENNQEKLFFYEDLLNVLNLECAVTCGDKSLSELQEEFDNKFQTQLTNTPKFYFFHMKNTHGPFFVDEQCKPLEKTSSISDAKEKKEEYIFSILCLQKDLEKFINNIDSEAILILQSDHGPHFSYARTYTDLTDNEIQNRYRIFSSIRFNNNCQDNPSSKFGQVNTFVFVFKCLSEKEFSYQEIKTFYVPVNPRYDNIVEITDRLKF